MSTMPKRKPGPPSRGELLQRVDHAIRSRGDRIALNQSPLSRHPVIVQLAAARYARTIYPDAAALRSLLDRAVADTVSALEHDPGLSRVQVFLRRYQAGVSIAAIGAELGLSREHCSRALKRQALELVSARLFQLLAQLEAGLGAAPNQEVA